MLQIQMEMVEGQAQGGEKEGSVLAIPPLEEEDAFIYVLLEGDGANEDPMCFGFNEDTELLERLK